MIKTTLQKFNTILTSISLGIIVFLGFLGTISFLLSEYFDMSYSMSWIFVLISATFTYFVLKYGKFLVVSKKSEMGTCSVMYAWTIFSGGAVRTTELSM